MFCYVYVLQSEKDDKLYIGFTPDLKKRLEIHNLGLSKATKYRVPFVLVYYEVYRNKKDALDREKFFKTGWGRQYIKKVLKNYLDSIEKSKT